MHGLESRCAEDAALGHRDESSATTDRGRNHLDIGIAPRALPDSPGTDPNPARLCVEFTYDEAEAFSKFNAGTVRVNKRLTKRHCVGRQLPVLALHRRRRLGGQLDGVGGAGLAELCSREEGNSSFDVRHQVSGTYLYELPFGKDKFWVTCGVGSHILEGFSVSGTFSFATGGWLTPELSRPRVAERDCGTGGSLRPNLYRAIRVTAGGGSLQQWFNTAAYQRLRNTPGFCDYFGNAPRNSIEGPGTVSNNMSLSKTMQMGETRSMEIRATINNVFNTVQYSGVGTNRGFADLRPGNFGGPDAVVSVYGEVQVLKTASY